ncbi:MAG TPA: F0F1 ATP synthase subunit B [Aggregatilineales bacterium]|nr:F0F1 ATP synthase subunit B [Anaerolineales bacterium]HRE48276.1 F0F1 ATP synthase subunit B [Aggregatilineales bacterium]
MDRLGINPGVLLSQIVNFAIVATLLWLLVWKPMVKALETRRERIAKGLEDARNAENALANAERDAQKLIDERRREAAKIVEDARAATEGQEKSALEEARREAESIRARARQEAIEERNAILAEVRSQVGQIAIAAAERVVGQSIDQGKGKTIVNDFFTALPADVKKLGESIEVTSALTLTADEQAKIKSQLKASKVDFNVDPAILGGVILRSGDQVVDGSVRSKLSSLAAKMN